MPIQPTPPTPAPAAIPQRNDRLTYAKLMDKFITWVSPIGTEFMALATNAYNNAVDAYNSALAAAASALGAADYAQDAANSANTAAQIAGATKWVAGTNYGDGVVVWSPTDKQSYRKAGAGVSNVDPGVDLAGWVAIGAKQSNGLINVQTLAENLILNQGSARYQRLTVNQPGLSMVLPDATTITSGFDVFKLKLFGSSSLGICDKSMATLGFLAAGQETILDLIDNPSQKGVWETQTSSNALDVAAKIATVGTAGSWSIGSAYEKYRYAKLSGTLAVAAYISHQGVPILVRIDLTTGSLGTPFAVSGNGVQAGSSFAIFPLDASRILFVFDNTKMVVVTMAGVSNTIGSIVTLASTYGLFYPSPVYGTPNIIKLSPSLFLTVGGWGDYPWVTAIKITGDVITQQSVQYAATFIQSWGGFTSWVPLSTTSALLSSTTNNSSPYLNQVWVITVDANGVPSFGSVINREVYDRLSHCPLLPISSTKALHLLQTNGYTTVARVLTIAGATVTAGAETQIRADATNTMGFANYKTLKSVTHPNAYAYSSFEGEGAYFPMGGGYFAAQSKDGVLDVLNVDAANSVISKTTLALTVGQAQVLTDTNHHLTFNYADPLLNIGRVQLTNTGGEVLSQQQISAKFAPYFGYTVGQHSIAITNQPAPTVSQVGYAIAVDNAGVLKGMASYLASQQAPALFGSGKYAFQFSVNSSLYSMQIGSNNTLTSFQIL